MTDHPTGSVAIERIERKQADRIEELASYGINAKKGPYQGWIKMSATNVERVLKLLRKKKLRHWTR